jgi:hypothetical protein
MDLRWQTQVRDLDGTVVVVLEGRAQAAAGPELAERLLRLAHEAGAERVELNVGRCSGDLDMLVVGLLRELKGRHAPAVALTGLTQHQLRLLDYLGFGEPVTPLQG